MINKSSYKSNYEKSQDIVRSEKDASGVDWEKIYQDQEEPLDFSWRASQVFQHDLAITTLKQFGKEHYTSALDIGCSQGQFTQRLQEIASKIIAIDLSKTAIEKAQKRYGRNDSCNGNIIFEVGSLPYLNYNDNSYDLIVALEVLYYLKKEEQERGLDEIRRIMRDDGHLLFSTVIRGRPYFSYEEIINLISQNFIIKAEQFKYFKLFYMPFEVRIYYLWLYIELVKRVVSLSSDKFDFFFNSKPNSIKKTMAKPVLAIANKHIGSSGFALKLFQKSLSALQYPFEMILRSMTLTRFGVFLTKAIMGRKGATGVVILAEKKR